MKILFIVPYPIYLAPSQRLKFEQHFKYFKEAGIECIVRPFMSKAFYQIAYKKNMYLRKIFFTLWGYAKRLFSIIVLLRCDLVFLHLEATPFGPPFFEYIYKLFRKPIIYDIDDVIFLPNYSQANRLIRFLDNPNKIFKIFKISSHIIVVTNYLKERALEHNSNVTFIPPTIDTDKYYLKNNYHKNEPLCIGWSGSRTTSEYLKLLENVLKEISARFNVKIKVIGDADFIISGVNNLSSQPWQLVSEVDDLQEIDIGLYPLPDTEWIQGKGGLKALQYMGLGIPVVCSRRGACLEFIKDSLNGFFADSDEEWIEKISRLINDGGLRQKIGMAGRRTVEDVFSVKGNTFKYIEVINQVYRQRYSKQEL